MVPNSNAMSTNWFSMVSHGQKQNREKKRRNKATIDRVHNKNYSMQTELRHHRTGSQCMLYSRVHRQWNKTF